ncbi:MAG: response regulator [Desulfuromonadales bacterium]|nr:response regulator [Desulfuromonadales bacterium]NIS42430.1 response regulator [Desulfuromonadales bacterium]
MAGKVLVVEDHDKFAALLQTLLERNDYAVERASDGVAALTAVARSRPDAVLLDLRLPRLSGAEVLKKIRRAPATRDLPVVVISGAYRGEENGRAVKKLGADAFIEKPCRPGQILQALAAAVKTTPPAGDAANTSSFGTLLVEAFRSRFCGRYLLTVAGREHQLTLLNGIPLYLRPGFRFEDFGSFLHQKTLINEEMLAYYRSEAQRDHFVFVQAGYLEYADLLQQKMLYLTEELSSDLQIVPDKVQRQEHAFPPGLQPITVNVPQILYQGYRRQLKSFSALQRHAAQYVAPGTDYYRYINFMALSLEDRQLLQRLDGQTRLDACLEGHDNPAPLFKTLTALGMLRFAESPLSPATAGDLPIHNLFNHLEEEKDVEGTAEEAYENFEDLLEGAGDFPAPKEPEHEDATGEPTTEVGAQVRKLAEELTGKNYYDMLGLSQQQFSFDTLKENYFRLTRQLGPEVIMQLTGEEAALAEDLLSSISSAYNTLSDVVKKERYDEMLGADDVGLGREGDDEFQAEVQFQSGKVFIDMEDWDGAEKALREAYNADQDDGLVLAHLAWSIFKNPKNENSRAMRDKARQMLNRALTLDRTAEGFAFKGWMLIEGDQTSLAEAEFNKALKLNARNPMARKGLRLIQERREQEKKGLFRRMFT